MTLRRQLFLGITFILLAVYGGILVVSTHLARDYLQQQLASHAQDTATALAHELSDALAAGDTTLAETQMASVFDRGYFRRMVLVGPTGRVLVQREMGAEDVRVPAWFVRLFRVETPPGEALLSSGWRQLGRIVVTSEPTLAYEHLWQTSGAMGLLVLAALMVSLSLTHQFLRRILQPLHEVEAVARDFCDKRFTLIRSIPATRELRRVVLAMNDAARRIARMLDAEEQRVETFRREAYVDEVTGLANRRNFDLRFNQILREAGTQGTLFLLELEGLPGVNLELGYPAGNRLLARVAREAAQVLGDIATLSARISGSSFAFVSTRNLPGEPGHHAMALLKTLTVPADGVPLPDDVHFHVGITSFRGKDTVASILATADIALEKARQGGKDRFAILDPDSGDGPQGSLDWRHAIEEALVANRLVLMAQPVMTLPSMHVMHREVMARLQDRNGEWLQAARFIPMAQRHHFIVRVDRLMTERALDLIRGTPELIDRLALNLAPQSLANEIFRGWLFETLQKETGLLNRLAFELPEIAGIEYPGLLQELRSLLHPHGGMLGLEQFGLDPQALGVLRTVCPDYIKLDAGLLQDASRNADSRRVMDSILQQAHALDALVIAQCIETEALSVWSLECGFDGAQGYFFGRPTGMAGDRAIP